MGRNRCKMISTLALLTTISAIGFIAFSVVTKNKTVGAFAQLGELQERENARRTLATPVDTSKIRTQHKIAFTIGVINTAFTSFLIGKAPTSFYLWHSPKAVVLIFLRWWAFRSEKKHYLLYDFCYWANGLVLLYTWVFPHNATLFQISFLCANGPLAWSILAFNQALVFHSWQHVTSVFIHISPMFLTYGLRWHYDDQFTVCDDMNGDGKADLGDCGSVGSVQLLWDAMTKFYLWWIVLYYVWVFVVLGKYIEQKGFQTLYDRVTNSGPLAPLLRRIQAHHLIKKAVYILFHLVFGFLTMMLACVLWHNHACNFLFLLAMPAASAWNAATFYFDVFSKKYEKILESSTQPPSLEPKKTE
eukprot:c17823_g1_i1.p1 GENE.c17823_g1_i1~~c17823_g1_i1.p1  ORF type:complete len:360 (-),score=62.00 c17823_g1_i1:57-1136(-)